ncbi:hypothetical protein [Amycolatopsis aidingensis]|uniref:hypothetical protein n=1 Tax=Amycolatopsis aidingensis TaxID=2842453 RepID=UPI001C0AAFA5|nr:hypothetical protein [Amycolatopsis aidingensis]
MTERDEITRELAARAVQRHARDAAERAELLDMLGLSGPAGPEPPRRPRAGERLSVEELATLLAEEGLRPPQPVS